MLSWPSCFYCDMAFETHEARCVHMRVCGAGCEKKRTKSSHADAGG